MFIWWKKLKERINKALLKMAENNKKNFGAGRMNCCDMKKPKVKKGKG